MSQLGKGKAASVQHISRFVKQAFPYSSVVAVCRCEQARTSAQRVIEAAGARRAYNPSDHLAVTLAINGLRRLPSRRFFPPTTLERALGTFAFVQADPIRARLAGPDLATSRREHRAGDLERRYATLDVEEDFFVSYGFVARRPGVDASHGRAS